MDLTTVLGLVIGFGSILLGQVLEGGHIGSISQPTAGLIVLGGTIGAVSVQFKGSVLLQTVGELKHAFLPVKVEFSVLMAAILSLANKARREGLVAIESEVNGLPNPFMKKAFEMAVDGAEAAVLRSVLELELTREEENGEEPIKVLEAAGGYSPTVGILGAVLGLIHVMENLSDPSALGTGIAVAFVATVYGVALANLLFLPLAGKLKARHKEHTLAMELVIEGVCAVAEAERPNMIERRLSVYVGERKKGATPAEAQARAEAQAA